LSLAHGINISLGSLFGRIVEFAIRPQFLLALVAVSLVIVLLASAFPAWRASTLSPIQTSRQDWFQNRASRRLDMKPFIPTICLAFCVVHQACAAESFSLLAPDQSEITFKLRDKKGGTPRVMLFDSSRESDTADSINFWRGSEAPPGGGVAVEFKGIRFLRDPENPDRVVVRLVGITNELELNGTLSIRELESGKEKKLHFGPAVINIGVISLQTDAEMELQFDSATGTLDIKKVSGKLEWARLFKPAQSDSGSLSQVTGAVGEVEPGNLILKPNVRLVERNRRG
jgi:hypothetical protein